MSLTLLWKMLVLAGPSLRHFELCVYLEVIVIVMSRVFSTRAKAGTSQELLAPPLRVLVFPIAM